MSALEARALTKAFSSHPVLETVSFRVHDAERFVILGPSAAGKTTLLRVLAGLETPDSGTVELDGRDVTGLPAQRRRVGLVFQAGALFPHLSVFENLAFPLRTGPLRNGSLKDRVAQTASIFGLQPLIGRSASSLSGGESQRVAIARALLADPRVLLLDEPLAHLDPSARGPIRDALLHVTRDAHKSLILVTHDHEEALAIADRLAILIDGRIAQCDTPARVYDAPASTSVARFLGPMPMNLIEDGGQQLGYENAILGIRPQDIRFNGGGAGIDGVIGVCEFAGSAWVAHVQTAVGLIRVADPGFKPVAGDKVRLAFVPEKIRRFDPLTGDAIA